MPHAVTRRFAAIPRVAAAIAAYTFVASAWAQTAALFFLQDQTNLTPGTYQIYVTGYSTNTPYVLQQDGSWAIPTAVPAGTTATLPCYRFPQDITQIQVYNTANKISARAYYFIVTDTAKFPQCNPTAGQTGLFNVPTAFTYTDATSMNVAQPPTATVAERTFPAWTYSEIGAGPSNGTIDLSQVDFYGFPMTTTGTVSGGPSVIGNPAGANNPANVVNHMAIRDSYRTWIDARAHAISGKSCTDDATPMPCAYLDLLQTITTPGSVVPQYVIQNPGGYLAQYTTKTQASRLNDVFSSVITALWEAPSPPSLVLRSGGILGTVPDDVFTSTIVTIPYPGASPPLNVRAMKFTGTAASGNYIAYVVDPNDYNTGCQSGQIASCINASSPGYQVFAGAGTFNTPTETMYNTLLAGGYLSASAATYGLGGYQQLTARLSFLISGAMNRGVALANCGANDTWKCWQDETYWYPTTASSTYSDITQNLFARWMHTATIGGTPMFVRPPGAVNAATGAPGQGATMGMAYGFSNDENPTPVVPSPPALISPQPEVPSKFDNSVVYGTGGTIVFGPWVTGASYPMLTVLNSTGGMITSSPGDINCGNTCSQSYPPGTTITLTATPRRGAVFVSWAQGCSGSSTTCTLTMTASTTVAAVFAGLTGQGTLSTFVTGNGSVGSNPAGIDCGTGGCSVGYAIGTPVTLTAVPAPGAAFLGWSGACTGIATTCVVPVTDAHNVGAAFSTPGNRALTVAAGAGGTVGGGAGSIDCGVRCIAGFAPGTPVTLVARPEPGYLFAGWSGSCSGTQSCSVVMSSNASVQAAFVPVSAGTLALTVRSAGGGTVQSAPSGIVCGGVCSSAFASDTRVSLTAVPQAGYRFAGWTGACSGLGACTVYMDASLLVEARFAPDAAPVYTEAIPTLSEWAMLLLATLMALTALPGLRRQHARRRGRR